MKKIIFIIFVLSFCLLIYFLKKEMEVKKKESLTIIEQKPEVKTQIELTGWFSYYDEDKSRPSLQYVFPYLNLFSPALYEVSSEGKLKEITVRNRENILAEAEFYKLPIYPVINDGGQRAKLLFLLEDEDKREAFVDGLINEANEYGFKGFAIDFESLKSEDTENFIDLSKYFYEKLKENDLEFHNILYGREENETYNPARAHPYKELSEYADRIYLMVYNYNNAYTDPGGQTPVGWYKKVLDYAQESIPKEKIVIGLSSHGYQWTGSKIKGLTFWNVLDIIHSHNPLISFDASQSAKTFKYNNSREETTVYYDDAQSIVDKIKIASNEYGINKFAIWRIGAEDPSVWRSILNLE